jgi:hypothetical protein
MDYKKTTRKEMITLCKTNNLKNYSKLTKYDAYLNLKKVDVEFINVPEAGSKSSTTKTKNVDDDDYVPPKPRNIGLPKKLEIFIPLNDSYKENLSEFGEDVEDSDIIDLISDDITKFITSDSVTNEDRERYVTKAGGISVAADFLSEKNKFTKFTSGEMYKVLSIYLYKKDTSIYANVVKKFKKYVIDFHKKKALEAVKTAKAAKTAKVEKAGKSEKNDSEPEDNSSDNESNKESENDE